MLVEEGNIYYVYAHIRDDNNEIFYIGAGVSNGFYRAYETRSRNKFWHNVVNKTSYTVKILFSNLSFEQSRNKEVRLIKLLGRRDLKQGILVNLTDGGEGLVGYQATIETREKLRKAGFKRRSTPATKQKLREYHLKQGLSKDRLQKMYEGRKLVGWHLGKEKEVICTITGIIFPSIKDAAIYLNIHRTYLAKMLADKKRNNTSFILND